MTVSGRVSYKTVPPNKDEGLRGHYYARLTLDWPLCLLDSGYGAEPNARAVAVVPEGIKPEAIKEGQHVTLSGKLFHHSTSIEPPEHVMLDLVL